MSTENPFIAKESAIKAPPMKPIVGASNTSSEQNNPLPADVMARVDMMPHDELKTLVRRLLCQYGAGAIMTEEEINQAFLDKLTEIALKPIGSGMKMRADIQSCMAAINQRMDRTKGKPAQSIAMEVNSNVKHQVLLAATNAWMEAMLAPVIENQ